LIIRGEKQTGLNFEIMNFADIYYVAIFKKYRFPAETIDQITMNLPGAVYTL
jgi:hypothetical protein